MAAPCPPPCRVRRRTRRLLRGPTPRVRLFRCDALPVSALAVQPPGGFPFPARLWERSAAHPTFLETQREARPDQQSPCGRLIEVLRKCRHTSGGRNTGRHRIPHLPLVFLQCRGAPGCLPAACSAPAVCPAHACARVGARVGARRIAMPARGFTAYLGIPFQRDAPGCSWMLRAGHALRAPPRAPPAIELHVTHVTRRRAWRC